MNNLFSYMAFARQVLARCKKKMNLEYFVWQDWCLCRIIRNTRCRLPILRHTEVMSMSQEVAPSRVTRTNWNIVITFKWYSKTVQLSLRLLFIDAHFSWLIFIHLSNEDNKYAIDGYADFTRNIIYGYLLGILYIFYL